MKTITAIFIGKDGSLGYTHGQEYTLEIKSDEPLTIRRYFNGGGVCAYTSLASFLDNWTNIKNHD